MLQANQKFFEKYGIDLNVAQQGSGTWMQAKLGVLSASNAEAILAGVTTATRATYMADLVAQIATGIFPEVNAAAMNWGKTHEDSARASYEFATDSKIEQVSFIFADANFRIGASPDGFINGKRGVEIKCPYNSKNYIEFLTADKVKPEWLKQANFSMWAFGLKEWDFAQYDPRMKKNPLHKITLLADEKLFAAFDDCVPQFIADMDKMLAKAGFKFGDQLDRLAIACPKAI